MTLSASAVALALRADEGPRFDFQAAGALVLPGAPSRAHDVDVGDLNSDGLPDAVASFGGATPRLRAYLAASPLTFVEASDVAAPFAGNVELADVNGDGAIDAAVHLPGNQFQSQLAIFTGDGRGSFSPLSNFFMGDMPTSTLVFTDLDADGNMDVLLAGKAAAAVFGPELAQGTRLDFNEDGTTGIAVLDVDGDGHRDVVLGIGVASPRFRLIRQLSGRQFMAHEVPGGASGPFTTRDTDGDGKIEVVGQRGSKIMAFNFARLDSGWNATGRALGTVNVGVEVGAISHVILDVDRDGLDDAFAVLQPPGLGVTLWGERSETGLILVQDGPAIPLPGIYPWGPVARQVDGDGLPDILLETTPFWVTPYVLGGGMAGWRASRRVADHDPPTTQAVAVDIDLDGYDDLALSVNGSIELRFGGESGLGPPVLSTISGRWSPFSAGRLLPGGPAALVIGEREILRMVELDPTGAELRSFHARAPLITFRDVALAPALDGEGAGILAVKIREGPGYFSESISRYEPQGPGALRETWEVHIPGSATMPRVVDLDGDRREDLIYGAGLGVQVIRGGPEGPRGYTESGLVASDGVWLTAAIDLEGDGRWEGVTAAGNNAGPTEIALLRRSADGVWASSRLSDGPIFSLAAADLDGDGHQDLAAGGGDTLRLFYNDGRGSLVEQSLRIPLQAESPLVAADIDGDAYLDLVTVSSDLLTVHFAESAGDFGGSRLLATPPYPFHFAAGDLDGDGTPEVAASLGQGGIVILDFSGREAREAAHLSSARAPTFLAIQDVDVDGREDLAILQGESVSWRRNLGDFAFEEDKILVEGMDGSDFVRAYQSGFVFADLNGDGLEDVFISGFIASLANGPASFGPAEDYRDITGFVPSSSLLDFDGDGALDVMNASADGGVVTFHAGDGRGGFHGSRLLPSGGAGGTGLALGDFDGDDRLDIALGSSGDPPEAAPRVWYSRAGGALERGPDLLDPISGNVGRFGLVTADLNGDGFDDLLCSDSVGYVLIYNGGAEGLTGPERAAYGPASPGFIVTGNFAGNEALDMVSGGEDGLILTLGSRTGASFLRGDANGDAELDLSDPIHVLGWLYLGGRPILCQDAADSNDDGRIDRSDAVFILSYKFLGGVPPPAPFPDCGSEDNADPLTCGAYAPCR